MKRVSVLAVLAVASLAAVVPLSTAAAAEVRWQDVVGIIQAGNLVGTGTGQVQGGGQPWSTTGGLAEVDLDTGTVRFRVRGLVLAGGNTIGTAGSITEVKGTLVCDADGSASGGNSVLVDTPLVPLTFQGDAAFRGEVGALPAACLEPDLAFLVRIGAGRWIANGAVRRP
jgi:hypothetical protein